MLYIVDKILIFAFSAIMSVFFMLRDYTLAVFCLSATFSGLFYLMDAKVYQRFLTIAFAGLSVWKPEFLLFTPLIVYDVAFSGIQAYALLFIPAVIMGIDFQDKMAFLYLLLLGVAVLCKYKTIMLEDIKKMYIDFRDSTTEYNNLLDDKNKQLIKNQNYEIKVATLNERNRISKELHDSIGHLLSRALIQVGALSVIAREEPVKKGLLELKNSLSEGMDSVRATIHNMRDDSFDLYTNIQGLIRGFNSIPVAFEYNVQSDPPIEVKYCIVSIIKEGLANIIKHSNATQCNIIVLEHTGLYQLIVYDNGKVNNPGVIESYTKELSAGKGMGLSGMIERVRDLNGIINITAEDGFKVFITIPKMDRDNRGKES